MIDISVIVCTYNHEKWIERCLRSLQNQLYINQKNFEIILIDDGSKDNTKKILRKLKKLENLTVVTNNKNIGLTKSLNKALKISSGRYVVRVDSDDYVHRSFLFLLKFFLDKNRQYHGVCVDYIETNSNEEEIKRENAMKKQIACGIMFRRECLFELGLYNEKFKMREGHELRIRFKKHNFKLGHLELPLYKYRKHQTNRTKNKKILSKYNLMLKRKKND